MWACSAQKIGADTGDVLRNAADSLPIIAGRMDFEICQVGRQVYEPSCERDHGAHLLGIVWRVGSTLKYAPQSRGAQCALPRDLFSRLLVTKTIPVRPVERLFHTSQTLCKGLDEIVPGLQSRGDHLDRRGDHARERDCA